MLTLTPVAEKDASSEIARLYQSIKQSFGIATVPLIFQYLAIFPAYFAYIWQQMATNLADNQYRVFTNDIYTFARQAIDSIYTPSPLTQMIKKQLQESAEAYELLQFINQSTFLHSCLYLLSLALRESVKGTHFGVKQLPRQASRAETTIFEDITEGFTTETKSEKETVVPTSIAKRGAASLTTSFTKKYFDSIRLEMDSLIKREEYLIRRVALEKFALTKLPLLPHPFESSIKTIFQKTSNDPSYPELIYLLAELFPTQAPFRLMATAVMKRTLFWQEIVDLA